MSQNSRKKQKNEQEKENLRNPDRRDSHMSKTHYHSKQNHKKNSNEPEQAVPPKSWIVEEHPEWRDSEQTEERFAIRLPDKKECKKSAHLRHSADLSSSNRTITRAFSDACDCAQELPGAQGPGIERSAFEEWR